MMTWGQSLKVFLIALCLQSGFGKSPQKKRKHGALGPGSEDLDQDRAKEVLTEYQQTFHKEGDPLRKHGQDLACSACQLAAKRFQSKIASKIKGKLTVEQKRQIFNAGLKTCCAEQSYPTQMAIVKKNGREFYVDFKEAMGSQHGKVSVSKMSPEVKQSAISACQHVLEVEYREKLLQMILDLPKGRRASDIDIQASLCGSKMANVCEDADEEAEEGEL